MHPNLGGLLPGLQISNSLFLLLGGKKVSIFETAWNIIESNM